MDYDEMNRGIHDGVDGCGSEISEDHGLDIDMSNSYKDE